ncbi:MAG: hypothetical protein IJJ33_00505 [Victivallales bacterium]|nr:hypothetical protein [Victivallales bacterium]
MTFCLVCATVTELSLGRLGLIVPFTSLCGFYFAVAFDGKRSALPLLAALVAVDLGFARPFPIHLLCLPGILLLAHYWRLHGSVRFAWLQAVPGVILGTQAALFEYIHTVLRCIGKDLRMVPPPLLFLLTPVFFSFLLTPALVSIADALATLLGIRRYASAIRLTHVQTLSEENNG